MTVTVARHGTPGPDDQRLVADADTEASAFIASLEKSPGLIGRAFDLAVRHAQARCLVDPNADLIETWRAVVTAMQTGSALFAMTSASEDSVVRRIGDKVHTLPVTGPQASANVGNWLTAFYLAAVCREQQRITALCEIPVDALRSASAGADEFLFLWVDVLQAFWLGREGLAEKLSATIAASFPEVVRNTPQVELQLMLYPPINLLHALLFKGPESFNEALAEALELHRIYWTSDVERLHDVAGSLALAPLALACFAYDTEVPVEVESDYMPGAFLDRSWLLEFQT
ncbi:immunity 49 family protein [Nocardia sp. NPDC052566]|uniref:immunity 49 family protein n=1 Tax=Nocardia sp. NPDC052566 TaxID=3364330 RepID=UPI0037CC6981